MTLIELIVVLVVAGVMISLVGPFAVNLVESAHARNEKMALERWLRQQSAHAYAQTFETQLCFHKNFAEPCSNGGESYLEFNFIRFNDSIIHLNDSGFSEQEELVMEVRGAEDYINLRSLLHE